jgi:hypothetical protein
MFVLGIQGSPRKKGNTGFLLSAFMDQARKLGAKTDVIEVDKKNVLPCKEYLVCEKMGLCPIDDDTKSILCYGKLTSSLQQRPFFFTTPPPNSRLSLTGAKPSGLEKINSNWRIPAGNGDAVFCLRLALPEGKIFLKVSA